MIAGFAPDDGDAHGGIDGVPATGGFSMVFPAPGAVPDDRSAKTRVWLARRSVPRRYPPQGGVLGASPRVPQKASTSSGGQKQRVAIARSLCSSPHCCAGRALGALDPGSASAGGSN
jgi:hypothetical protein